MKHTTRSMSDEEPLLQVNPAAVECGFMMYPKVLVDVIHSGEFSPHQALEMNQPRFWPMVRRRNPQILIHLMCAVPTVEMSGIMRAPRENRGFLDGYSIAIGCETKISLDGGATTEELLVGFCWKSQKPEIIIIRLDGVVPRSDKPFWKCW